MSAERMDVDQFLDGGFLAAIDSPGEISDTGSDSAPADSADHDDDVAEFDTHGITSRAAAKTSAGKAPPTSGEPGL